MKLFKGTRNENVFIFCLVLILFFQLSFSYSLKRHKKARKIHPKKLENISQYKREAINFCIQCKGTAELLINKQTEEKIVCACKIDGQTYYSVNGEKVPEKELNGVEEKLQKNFKDGKLYEELETNCRSFCSIIEKHHLYKIIRHENAYVCKCNGLFSDDYYLIEGNKIEETKMANGDNLKKLKELEKEGKFIEIHA